MADLLLDIVQYLAANKLIVGDGVDAFRDQMPPNPDNIVIVNEYVNPDSLMNVGVATRNVQLQVRDLTYSGARTRCLAIHALIVASIDRVVNLTGVRWAIMYPKQTPCKIQIDPANRVIFGFNMSVTTYYD